MPGVSIGCAGGLPRPRRRWPRRKASPASPVGQEEQAGVGAELAGAERERADVRLGERGGVGLGERTGEHDHGVDRGHLGVDRDRHGARGRGLDEREPAAAGAGEADGHDPRVARPAPGRARCRSGRRRRAGTRTCRGAGPHFSTARVTARATRTPVARVGRVALDHDRAAGGERGGGVAARGGEGEREVAGAEDGDRAERRPSAAGCRRAAAAPARAWPGRCGRRGGRRWRTTPANMRSWPVVRPTSPVMRASGQVALGDGGLDDRVLVGLDLGGDRLEEVARAGRGWWRGRTRTPRPRRWSRRRRRPSSASVPAMIDRAGQRCWSCVPLERRRVVERGGARVRRSRSIRSRSSATSSSRRSVSGGRTGPAGRPTAARPPLTIETA